jgi:V8-like Glu-specific endopeptidase
VSLQDSSGNHQCGGTVVAPDIILSAGHCADAGITTAVVGVYDLSDLLSGNIEVFAFKKMY